MVDALAKLPEKDQERSLRHMLKASDEEVEDRNKKWAQRERDDSRPRSDSSKNKSSRTDSAAPPSDSSGDEWPTRSSRRQASSSRTNAGEGDTETPVPESRRPSAPDTATPVMPAVPEVPASTGTPASAAPNLPVQPESGSSRWPRRDRPRDAWRGNMAPN